jgi:iron-sulfur cluster assembly protein
MLTISRTAAEAIKRIVSSSSTPEGGLKISTTPDESPPSLSLTVAGEPAETDRVVERQGSRVFVEQDAATYVDGKVLDAEIQSGQIRFSLEEQGSQGS